MAADCGCKRKSMWWIKISKGKESPSHKNHNARFWLSMYTQHVINATGWFGKWVTITNNIAALRASRFTKDNNPAETANPKFNTTVSIYMMIATFPKYIKTQLSIACNNYERKLKFTMLKSHFDVGRQTWSKITILNHNWAILSIFSAHMVISFQLITWQLGVSSFF